MSRMYTSTHMLLINTDTVSFPLPPFFQSNHFCSVFVFNYIFIVFYSNLWPTFCHSYVLNVNYLFVNEASNPSNPNVKVQGFETYFTRVQLQRYSFLFLQKCQVTLPMRETPTSTLVSETLTPYFVSNTRIETDAPHIGNALTPYLYWHVSNTRIETDGPHIGIEW